MELKINVGDKRSVSAREVTRRMAKLLDEMEEEGIALIVLRYGRPAAMLVPLEPKVRRAPRRVTIEERDEPEEVKNVDAVLETLDEHGRLLLTETARCAPHGLNPNHWPADIGSYCVSGVRLELAGLVEKVSGRYLLTSLGERAASALVHDRAALENRGAVDEPADDLDDRRREPGWRGPGEHRFALDG